MITMMLSPMHAEFRRAHEALISERYDARFTLPSRHDGTDGAARVAVIATPPPADMQDAALRAAPSAASFTTYAPRMPPPRRKY